MSRPLFPLLHTLTLSLTISGCTFLNTGNDKIPVSLKMPDGLTETSEVSGQHRLALQIPFEDKRPSREYCGDQKITYGLIPGKIVCEPLPAVALADLLNHYLTESGYKISITDTPPMVNQLKIEGQLLQFYVEPVKGRQNTEVDIHVKLRATSANGLEAEREFFEKGRGSDYQRSVNSGIRKIIPAMAKAITELLEAHPALDQTTRE